MGCRQLSTLLPLQQPLTIRQCLSYGDLLNRVQQMQVTDDLLGDLGQLPQTGVDIYFLQDVLPGEILCSQILHDEGLQSLEVSTVNVDLAFLYKVHGSLAHTLLHRSENSLCRCKRESHINPTRGQSHLIIRRSPASYGLTISCCENAESGTVPDNRIRLTTSRTSIN